MGIISVRGELEPLPLDGLLDILPTGGVRGQEPQGR